MEHLKEISQEPHASVWGWFFTKKIHEGVFQHLVLNCTINRDICKRACLIGAFTQHLTHFWLGFLGLFFRPQMRRFGVDLIKKVHEGFFKYLVPNCTINRGLQKSLPDKCLTTVLNSFLVGLFMAPF